MYTIDDEKNKGTQIFDRYNENLEIYEEEAYDMIQDNAIVDLYFHYNCIELMYYTNNTYEKFTVGVDALDGISLRISVSYSRAKDILDDLGYEFYAEKMSDIRSDCLYSEREDVDYLKPLYLGTFIRQIWTKKEGIKPFRFERCAIPEEEIEE